jgi:hypothetical protein
MLFFYSDTDFSFVGCQRIWEETALFMSVALFPKNINIKESTKLYFYIS